MRTFYLFLFMSSCFFYGCLETDEFELIREDLNENRVRLENPIQFSRLAVGQKSRYVLTKTDSCGLPVCCQQTLDTLQVEILDKDTSGYLLKETSTLPNHPPLFFYLKYEIIKILKDTLENEPSVEEYEELYAIRTQAIDDIKWSYIYGKLGAKLYLNNPQDKPLISTEIDNLCEGFFLPMRAEDPLPYRENGHHSELGITKNYTYKDIVYGDLLVMNHDYGYAVDALNLAFGYSLDAGLVFSGTFHGGIQNGDPWVWHLVSDR